MTFRLNRLILIGSYCHNRIVEVDLTGHITINGENGAGKTTLLRLLPIFFGEKPSNIIRSDAVVEKFGRYYFPTTASYVIFEYQRRDQVAMAVVHADGQSDGVVYRLIDSEYKPELFRDTQGVVQTNKLHAHLEKLNVYDSKPLSLHAYRQIMQNTAGREHKRLISRFAFTSSTGRLTHLERIVTGILLRVTTFYDLKKMIVSSVLDGEEVFALRTSRKELLQWVSEYDAHYAVMEKAGLMQELETLDHERRDIEAGFSRLHAKLKLLHDYHDNQVTLAETEEQAAKDDKKTVENDYNNKLQGLHDQVANAKSENEQLEREVNNLNDRKKRYAEDDADLKVSQFEAIPALESELIPLERNLHDLESQVKSIAEVFREMEAKAQQHASNERSRIDSQRLLAHEQRDQRKAEISSKHDENRQIIVVRQESEREDAGNMVNQFKLEKSVLEASLKNVQPDPESQEALRIARQGVSDANQNLQSLHEKTKGLEKIQAQLRQQFEDLETQINNGELAKENTQAELERLVAANNADEDTLLGFLRLNKPEWVSDIGRVIPEDILLRNDLAPSLADGTHLYGVNIDLEKLNVGRFASEEVLQSEIKSLRERLQRKHEAVEEDRASLDKKSEELAAAMSACNQHEAEISLAKKALENAQANLRSAESRAENSKKTQQLRIQQDLDRCNADLEAAESALEELKAAHQAEVAAADAAYRKLLSETDNEFKTRTSALNTEKDQVDRNLQDSLNSIAADRDQSLRDNGVSPDTMNALRNRINGIKKDMEEARKHSQYVSEYKNWLENSWSRIQEKEIACQTAKSTRDNLERVQRDLLKERARMLQEKEAAIDAAEKKIELHVKSRIQAKTQLQLLSMWPTGNETLSSGIDNAWTIDVLSGERHRLQKSLDDCKEAIRIRVEEIRRQMCKVIGTRPESFYMSALNEIGNRPGREHEWIEVFRTWYTDRHNENQNSLTQMGRSMAQSISYFWKMLASFKRDVRCPRL